MGTDQVVARQEDSDVRLTSPSLVTSFKLA